jgi:Flp pilus assembly protein TadD
LREAGRLFEAQGEHGALLLETILALCAARIALGDGEGALLTAEAARDAAPHDPRTSIALADALVLAGRADDARAELEGALQRASGALWIEIQRRIAALDRREWRRSRR